MMIMMISSVMLSVRCDLVISCERMLWLSWLVLN